jgi:hypothetical protein
MKWFAALLRALSPNCKQASRLQSEALDHKLPFLQRVGLRIHLLICKWCRRYGQQLRFLRKAAHEHPDEQIKPADQNLSASARDRIKERLRAEKRIAQ